ncbi:MAG: hypothetical protein HYT39_00550 [Candidatus Sungbacteria bacterium]|nr:hypothetical protein [Candidatus Sungbacteria bacterium]
MLKATDNMSLNEVWWKRHHGWYWGVLFLVFFLGVASIFAVNVNFANDYARSQSALALVPKAESVIVRVDIDFGDKKRAFEGEARSGMTVASAVSEIADLAGLTFTIRQGAIAGLGGKNSKISGPRWTIYFNRVAIDKDALTKPLKGGDRLVLRYE